MLTRRTQLKRRRRLTPGGYLTHRYPARAYRGKPEALEYISFVRKLPCISCKSWSGSDASHVSLGPNEKGTGM